MNKPYFVVKCNGIDENFMSTLKKISDIDDLSSQNYHFQYIHSYFERMQGYNLKTVVFELNYIDKDYLEDYSHYYSRCFQDYKKKCIRLHFFSKSFGKKVFENYITSNNAQILQDNYLGFAVLRPLPFTLFGKMCLKTYSSIEKERFYPTVVDYYAHLYGIELKVESVAFQEQDNTISACATSALWSAFQTTGSRFHHPYPSPYKITRNATEYVTDYANKAFPNEGLLPNQMAHAVKKQDLEPFMLSYLNTSYFKAHIYAYLKCCIPVILGVKLKEIIADNVFNHFGKHAVCVTGYRLSDKRTSPFKVIGQTGVPNKKTSLDQDITTKWKKLYLKSSNIDCIYVHDDQIGPFSKMEFTDVNSEMSTTWMQFAQSPKHIIADPNMLLFPLYNKIRIPFTKVLEIINSLTIVKLRKSYIEDIDWDIYLTTVCDLKQKIGNLEVGTQISAENKLKLLTSPFPRYIWVADAYNRNGNTISFSYYFDATDIHNGNIFLYGIHYSDFYVTQLFDAAKESEDERPDPDLSEDYQALLLLRNYLSPASKIKTDKSKIMFSPQDKTAEITTTLDSLLNDNIEQNVLEIKLGKLFNI